MFYVWCASTLRVRNILGKYGDHVIIHTLSPDYRNLFFFLKVYVS